MFKNQLPTQYIMLLSVITIVGLYQLPNVENVANKYNINLEVNEKFNYSQSFQQSLENLKISVSSYLDQPFETSQSLPQKEAVKISMPLKKKGLFLKPNVFDSLVIPQNNFLDNLEKNNYSNMMQSNKFDIKPENILQKTTSNEAVVENPVLPTDNTNCVSKCTILMIGDSVMGDISFALQRLVKKEHPDWNVVDAHKVSSGLSNQTYYNWPLTAKKLIEQYKPHYTFVLFGTNDAQNLVSEGKARTFGKSDWQNAYSQRVNEITKLLDNNAQFWGWIQLPVVRDGAFNSRLQVIRNIQQENTNKHFITTEPIFGNLAHSENIDMKLRANDGTHLNSSGANLLAKHLYKQISN